ncbi:MAG: hypothetical protein ACREQL_14025 [Candidatus Binatia bacterium]
MKSDFDAFCRACFDYLAARRVPFLVIGGLAVIAVGEPRVTGDVDVVVFASPKDVERLIASAKKARFALDEAVERARFLQTGTLRMRRGLFQFDLIGASLPFERTALERSMRKRLFGRMVHLPTPEDLLLFKVLAGRDKDLVDAAGIIRRHGDALDLDYVRTTLRPICDLAEDLAPWRRLEQLLSKATPT